METRRLSTGATTFWKWVFTPSWIGGIGVFNVMLWLDLIGSPPAPLAAKVAILTLWLTFSPFFVWWARRLHHVWLEGDHLVVRPHGTPVRIPLTEVQEVRESRFQRVKLITIELGRSLPGVGREVVFVAPFALQRPFSDHPLVGEIRNAKRALAGVGPELSDPEVRRLANPPTP